MLDIEVVRRLADRAQFAQEAGEVGGLFGTANYAQGVEDALRYIAGDAPMTDDLRATVRYALRGDDA